LRIAVTGAGGRLGGQVVRILASEPAHEVVALSRRALPVQPDLPHVGVRIADYEDPAALAAALKDVETLVFVSSDGPPHRSSSTIRT
jgi:NAD(P)H dehydrogenase (quinone)